MEICSPFIIDSINFALELRISSRKADFWKNFDEYDMDYFIEEFINFDSKNIPQKEPERKSLSSKDMERIQLLIREAGSKDPEGKILKSLTDQGIDADFLAPLTKEPVKESEGSCLNP